MFHLNIHRMLLALMGCPIWADLVLTGSKGRGLQRMLVDVCDHGCIMLCRGIKSS
jgi:hypothetical protein